MSPRIFKNREFFNLKIHQATGNFKVKESKRIKNPAHCNVCRSMFSGQV